MNILFGGAVGFLAWALVRYFLAGLYTVDQNERAVRTVIGRAQRLADDALQQIAQDQEVFPALFDVLETQRLIAGEARRPRLLNPPAMDRPVRDVIE